MRQKLVSLKDKAWDKIHVSKKISGKNKDQIGLLFKKEIPESRLVVDKILKSRPSTEGGVRYISISTIKKEIKKKKRNLL